MNLKGSSSRGPSPSVISWQHWQKFGEGALGVLEPLLLTSETDVSDCPAWAVMMESSRQAFDERTRLGADRFDSSDIPVLRFLVNYRGPIFSAAGRAIVQDVLRQVQGTLLHHWLCRLSTGTLPFAAAFIVSVLESDRAKLKCDCRGISLHNPSHKSLD